MFSSSKQPVVNLSWWAYSPNSGPITAQASENPAKPDIVFLSPHRARYSLRWGGFHLCHNLTGFCPHSLIFRA